MVKNQIETKIENSMETTMHTGYWGRFPLGPPGLFLAFPASGLNGGELQVPAETTSIKPITHVGAEVTTAAQDLARKATGYARSCAAQLPHLLLLRPETAGVR